MSQANDILNAPIVDEATKEPPTLSQDALISHKEPLSYTKAMQVAGIFDCSSVVCYWNVSRKCLTANKCVGHPSKDSE